MLTTVIGNPCWRTHGKCAIWGDKKNKMGVVYLGDSSDIIRKRREWDMWPTGVREIPGKHSVSRVCVRGASVSHHSSST